MTEFEQFAMDHNRHKHCIACAGCILDRRPVVMENNPIWCAQCADKIEATTKPGRRPWDATCGFRIDPELPAQFNADAK